MNEPVDNPFFTDDSGLNYMPKIADIEQEIADAALLDEIKEGQLNVLMLTKETAERLNL